MIELAYVECVILVIGSVCHRLSSPSRGRLPTDRDHPLPLLPYRLEDLELGTGEGVKQIVKVCFIVDNG